MVVFKVMIQNNRDYDVCLTYYKRVTVLRIAYYGGKI